MDLRRELLGAIRSYLAKNGSLHPDEARHLAEDCAQEAILIIQAKLDSFRGESRVTTWALSIAVRIVLGELRRRRWQQASVEKVYLGQILPDWPTEQPGPERTLQQREAWALLGRIIDTELTQRQRTALIAHVFEEMPLDLVAEWLGTSRNNLYKLIHDARKRLKEALLAQGITHNDLIAAFDEPGPKPNLSSGGKNSFVERVL